MGTFLDAGGLDPEQKTRPQSRANANASTSAPRTFLDSANAASARPVTSSPDSSSVSPRTFLDGVAPANAPKDRRRIDLSRLGKLLDAQRAGSQEAIFHGGSSDENRKRLREKLGIEADYKDPKLFGTIDQPEWATHLERGLVDTAVDTISDPLTYESFGTGAIGKLGLKALGAGAKLLPAPARQAIAATRNAAQDAFSYGGAAQRVVGQAGVDTAIGALSKHATRAKLAEDVLAKRFDELHKGLTNDEWADVLRIRNAELPHGDVPQIVVERANALKTFTNQLQKMRGGSAYREHYIPGTAEANEVRADRPASRINLLEQPYDVHELQRDRFAVDASRLGEHNDAFRGAIRSAMRQQMGRDLSEELGKYFGGKIPTEVRALFDREIPASGSGRSFGDYWRGVVALPKSAIVGTSPRHMVNIADLLSQRSLSALPEAAMNAARIVAKPSQRANILDRGIELGAISPTSERTTPIADWLGKMGVVGALPAKAMRAMNDATWAFDDAAVQALAKRNAARGMTGYTAGRQARRDLVDYEHVSPFTEKARNLMPFATFNTQTPGNVLRAVAQDPMRIEALDRASAGTYTGGTYTAGDGRKFKLHNPTADIGRLDPAEFARRTIADPIRAVLDFAGATAEGKKHYFEYGQDTHDPKTAAKLFVNALFAGVPGAREALSQGGLGPFKPRSILEDLFAGSTGISIR